MTSWAYARRLLFFAIVAGSAFGCAEQSVTDPIVSAENVAPRRFYEDPWCQLRSYTDYSRYWVCEGDSGAGYQLPPVIIGAVGGGAYSPPPIPDECYYSSGGMCDPDMCFEMPGGCGGDGGQSEPSRPNEISEADWTRLNWKEKRLCAAAPGPCVLVFANAVKAVAWVDSLIAAEDPQRVNLYKYAAMQHALWAALNTRDVGQDVARKFLDAHELSSTHPGDTCMDLRNNSYGSGLAVDYGYLSDDSYKTLVTQMANAQPARLQMSRCGFYE